MALIHPHAEATLKRLRAAGYRRLGAAPNFRTPEEQRRILQANLKIAQPGGVLERDLLARGLPPERVARELSLMRDAFDQDIRLDRSALERHDESDIIHDIDPGHHNILSTLWSELAGLGIAGDDGLPGRLHDLADRIMAEIIPTGDMNARAFRIAGDEAFVIGFDPSYFDFINIASMAIGSLLDADNVLERAERFGRGYLQSHEASIVTGENLEFVNLIEMSLRSYVLKGLPSPLARAYREESFRTIDLLRWSSTLFVMSHEVAHILLQHLDGLPTHQASWQQELEADHLGWRLTEAILGAKNVPQSLMPLGGYLFLGCGCLIDLARDAIETGISTQLVDRVSPSVLTGDAGQVWKEHFELEKASEGITHPPSQLRLAHFALMVRRGFSAEGWKQSMLISLILFDLLGQIWRRIEPGFLKLHATGAEISPVWNGYGFFMDEFSTD